MRLFVLLTPLLLAGCINDSATYYINGSDHALTLRATQQRFWNKDVTLELIATRMPDCQRRIALGAMPAADTEIELFGTNDNVFLLRAGADVWRIDTGTCSELEAPEQVQGEPLGLFEFYDGKLVFEKAEAEPASAPR